MKDPPVMLEGSDRLSTEILESDVPIPAEHRRYLGDVAAGDPTRYGETEQVFDDEREMSPELTWRLTVPQVSLCGRVRVQGHEGRRVDRQVNGITWQSRHRLNGIGVVEGPRCSMSLGDDLHRIDTIHSGTVIV